MKQRVWFVGVACLAYVFSYLIAGGLAYQLITKQFYVGDSAVFTAYLRSEANPVEWVHVNTWMFPALLLRGVFIALVLLPFAYALKHMSFRRRFGSLFLVSYLLLHLVAGAPSPGNIEGFVYMKPELMSLKTFLLVQPEMLLQSLLYAGGVTWWMERKFTSSRERTAR